MYNCLFPARVHPGIRTLVLALTLIILGACSKSAEDLVPEAAPNFTLPRVDGGTLQLAEQKGKVVLLDFWATWCPPCRVAMPHLAKLQTQYGSDGLVVLGMNLDNNREDLDHYLASEPVNYPILLVDAPTRQAYGGVASVPQTILIDRTGKVRHKFLGYDHKVATAIENALQALLQEAP